VAAIGIGTDASPQAALDRARLLVLPELIGRSARAHPERPALLFGSERRTYGELDERARRLAAALAERGAGPGDRIALLLHNGFEFVEALLACHLLGAGAVPINFRLVTDEVAYILADSDAVGVVVGAELGDVAAEAAAHLPSLRFRLTAGDEYEAALEAAAPLDAPAAVAEGDPALVLYTSGTTGRPKGAVLSHRSLVMSTLSWIHEMRASSDDVWLSGQPLFHIGGINGLLPFLFLGATMVVSATTGFDAAAAVRRIDGHGVTMCIFVPTQWEEVCTAAEEAAIDCARLRVAMWGASSCPRSTLERIARTFPRAEIVSAYGQTETAGATTLLKGSDATRKLGSVGTPMLGVELRVVDDELREVPPGTVGEIVYRGPTLTTGYLGNEEATNEAFAGGWFHSGDLATRDEEGYVTIVDRKKDVIISGGENVYPAEIERALLDHRAVADAAVVGAAHPRWVETPVAFVVPAPGESPSERELIEHCRTLLAGYKRPSRVVFVDALPRNAAGKVLRRELRPPDTSDEESRATSGARG
jgi:acyl-CoA synthetase (AMP-forming)/AMP-acid ligase II